MRKHLVLFGLLVAGLQSCFYDKVNELHPKVGDPCDTTVAASYTESVGLIVNTNCVSCHSGSSPSGGLRLETYAQVVASVNSGKLLPSIKHEGSTPIMPPDAKIRDCEITKIETWIQKGLPEN